MPPTNLVSPPAPAETPPDGWSFPVPGGGRVTWRVFFRCVYDGYDHHSVANSAASLGYYFVFSLFPFLFFLATLTAFLPIIHPSIERMLSQARAILPSEAMALIDTHVKALIKQPHPKLLGLTLIATLYSASRGVDAVRKALNLAYDVKETRPFWKTEGLNFGLTIGGAVLLLVGITALVAGGDAGFWVARHAHIGDAYVLVWKWARWPVTALIAMWLAALTYYLLPDVEQEFRFITPGSIASVLVSLGATWGFSEYAAHFGSYNLTYGSIGGVIVLMTWFYMTGFIYLVGGEINAILEHHSWAGKERGARAPSLRPPPVSQRPSAADAPPTPDEVQRAADAHAVSK